MIQAKVYRVTIGWEKFYICALNEKDAIFKAENTKKELGIQQAEISVKLYLKEVFL